MKKLVDFTFNSLQVANPDGTLQTNFLNANVVSGPGNTVLGNFPLAIDLENSGKAVSNLSGIIPNSKQFCINIIFKATKEITERQNLVESDFLPFSISLSSALANGKFHLNTSVKPKNHNWNGPDTVFKKELLLNKWYTVTMAYDYDTVALFIDNNIVSIHAFPEGSIDLFQKKQLFFGTWIDGVKHPFSGQLAAFQWFDGIPQDIEAKIDEKRLHAEWFITHKNESLKKSFNIGERTEKLKFVSSTGAYIQYYKNCAIMYHYTPGVAFEMHGAIYDAYKSMSNNYILGFLISDESNSLKSKGRKNLFSKGGIYWSAVTGAHPVLENIYVEYENTDEAKSWGFPTKPRKSIPGGYEQEFEGCRYYYKLGDAKAHEVHGEILTKFLALGGVSKYGFPVSNENDVKKQSTLLGKFSEFEGCTIYWKNSIGAFEIHGDIRKKYQELNGPLSDLGFPTSDETNLPGVIGAKANTFQKGSILWYGSYNSIIVARPFKIRIGRLNTKETEGALKGQNDIYFKTISLNQDGNTLINERKPKSGSWSGKNIVNVDYTLPVLLTPNKINTKYKFYVNIKEEDDVDDNDHIGTYEKELNAANAWGLKDNNGVYDVSFGKVKSMGWTVVPQIDIKSLNESEKWWGPQANNRGTVKLTYDQYASAFKGVDSETEWWDITDWLEKAFYSAVVEEIANGGNCFGMSLEGIYSLKKRSIYSMPINRFNWTELVKEFNIKQSYQVGADPIWWFLGQFLSGNTHNPVDVFNETEREYHRGNNPVLCLAQNWDFTGAPHAVMPVKWDKSSKPWKITINDPNGPSIGNILTVNPDNNTFNYKRTGGTVVYQGAQWSGGRLHYMPYSLLNSKQRLIVWDLLLLLLSGTILILADDGETTAITDVQGNDLNSYGSRATSLLKEGKSVSNFFTAYNGFDGALKPGQLLLRKNPAINNLEQSNMASEDVEKVSGVFAERNFIHTIKGKKEGKFNYIIKSGMSTIKMESNLQLNEIHKVEVRNLGTNFCNLKLKANMSKNVKMEIYNQISAKGDYQLIKVDNFPISAGNSLDMSIKQGLGGIEILNSGSKFNLSVQISSKINKVVSKRDFQIEMDKGVRLMPCSLVTDNELQISKINKIFGESLGTFRM